MELWAYFFFDKLVIIYTDHQVLANNFCILIEKVASGFDLRRFQFKQVAKETNY